MGKCGVGRRSSGVRIGWLPGPLRRVAGPAAKSARAGGALRDQPALFGPVALQATAWRTFDRLGPAELRGIDGAVADARAAAWDADRDVEEAELIIDMDATL